MEIKNYFKKNEINNCLSCKNDFSVSGLSQGERAFFVSLFDKSSVIIVSDFISANVKYSKSTETF